MYGYFDETAEAVVQELHVADAAANATDIQRMRAMVRCDLKRVYRRDDSFDMHHWLAMELGISTWKAARWLRAGYALDELPVLTHAFEAGDISTDKFVELARFATRATEEDLLPWAMRTSPAGIRARADQELRAPAEETKQADRWRSLTWEWDEGNTRLSLWGSLPVDQGAKFVKGVERLADKMPVTPEDDTDPAENLDARRADALVAMASASIADDHAADRATLVVHTDIDGLLEKDRNSILHGGLPIPPQAASILACDSRVQTVLHDENGSIFHISSPTYIVPKWLRRQVEHRDDYRCTFPNCGRRAFTEAHHIEAWPKGKTELSNLTLLCHIHHRLVHIYGWHVRLAKNGMTEWFRPDWTPYSPRPAPPPDPLTKTSIRGVRSQSSFVDHQLETEGSG